MTAALNSTDYRLIFESSPCLMLVLTPKLEVVTASDAYLRATMTTREAIAGRFLFDVFPDNPDDPDATGMRNLSASLEHVRQHHVADAMAPQRYDIRQPSTQGGCFEERFWSVVNSPVLDAKGKLRLIIHRVDDVTGLVHKHRPEQAQTTLFGADWEKREMELLLRTQEITDANFQLKKLSAALAVANSELESFSYSVSHDLRAPLRAIDGFARMLEDRANTRLDDEDMRLLSVIRDSSKTMGRLIDDLLHFSRLSRHAPHYQNTRMQALVQSVWQEVGADYTGEFHLQTLPDACGDAALLRQVWSNLLGNAVKYTSRREHPSITVSADADDLGPVYHIRDNGAGFDMRYANKLFQVFQRLHRSSEFEGTGIGLAIVARIINRHGGRVWAEGVPGQGASFHFSLPAQQTGSHSDGDHVHALR